MEGILNRTFFSRFKNRNEKVSVIDKISQGKTNTDYRVTDIKTNDEELKSFLFTLGCYAGEIITLISIIGDIYVINIKEARYSIDKKLAEAIKVEAV